MDYQQIVDRFMEDLREIDLRHGPTLKMAIKGIRLSNQALRQLREEMDRTGFGTIEEEITFFKSQKVFPLGKLVFFNEIRCCELTKPKAGPEQQLGYFEKQIRRVNRFFSKYWSFINYMEQGHEHLDREYFSRQARDISYYALPDAYYLDSTFFSSHDLLWARINAMGEYADFLQEEILHIRSFQGTDSKGLIWTASKTALTELIYGLYSSSVFNNGQQDLGSIASAFEQFFNVRLDNIYKTYSEIKIRKAGHAKFLEEMTYRYLQKIKDDDSL